MTSPRATRTAPSRRLHPLVAGLTLLLTLALVQPAPTLAHDGKPVGRESIVAGPYRLDVIFYNQPRAGQELQFVIVPPEGTAVRTVQVSAQPGLGTAATPQRGRVGPDPDRPGAWGVAVLLPVTGAWILRFEVAGDAGGGQGRLPVTAAAPAAVPVPVGWAIGLSPLVGVLAFAIAQRRWLLAHTEH